MSETEIQRLRIRIINGLSISSQKLMNEKKREQNPIAVIKNNRVAIVPADELVYNFNKKIPL
ncbi:MAG TPA: hypothetical protein PK740_01225 [Bacteroidales bacterium]|nr:hypothetical protein [Bacteroidales bacterium]